jgi:hypothetical protein
MLNRRACVLKVSVRWEARRASRSLRRAVRRVVRWCASVVEEEEGEGDGVGVGVEVEDAKIDLERPLNVGAGVGEGIVRVELSEEGAIAAVPLEAGEEEVEERFKDAKRRVSSSPFRAEVQKDMYRSMILV